MNVIRTLLAAMALGFAWQPAQAGVLDPDCTAEKAAKSAVAKATVGVGGRCTAAEAAKDTVGGAVEDVVEETKEDLGLDGDGLLDRDGKKDDGLLDRDDKDDGLLHRD